MFLSDVISSYVPAIDFFKFHVGCVPKSRTNFGVNEVDVLGSDRKQHTLSGPWIREPNGKSLRVFCNAKTRKPPFFSTQDAVQFDGSLIGVETDIDPETAVTILNSVKWEDQSQLYAGRYQFTQRSLTNSLIHRNVLTDNFVHV